jgi:hypothetical protein
MNKPDSFLLRFCSWLFLIKQFCLLIILSINLAGVSQILSSDEDDLPDVR